MDELTASGIGPILRAGILEASVSGAAVIICALFVAFAGVFARFCRRCFSVPDGDIFNTTYIITDLAHGFTLFPFLLVIASSAWNDVMPSVVQSNKYTILYGALVSVTYATSGVLRCKLARPE